MKGKRLLALLVTAAVLLTGAGVLASGGTATDPLLSLSYLREIFINPTEAKLTAAADGMLEASFARLSGEALASSLAARMDAALADALEERVAARVAARLAAGGTAALTNGMSTLTLAQGDRIVGPPGGAIVLTSGTAQVCGPAGSVILNATVGATRTSGADTRTGVYYLLLADDGSGLEITSATATALVKDGARRWTATPAYTAQYRAYADALSTLGLFLGSDKGFELERAPTRQEALIMLIRLLGEEQEALRHTAPSTFGDVTGWLEGQYYIAYGQARGYTNGAGLANGVLVFRQRSDADLNMYLTFVLRALGYDDAAGDFVWNSTSRTLAVSLGLLTEADVAAIAQSGMMRDHVAYISYHALAVRLKGSTSTLGDKLVASGAITRAALNAAAGLA